MPIVGAFIQQLFRRECKPAKSNAPKAVTAQLRCIIRVLCSPVAAMHCCSPCWGWVCHMVGAAASCQLHHPGCRAGGKAVSSSHRLLMLLCLSCLQSHIRGLSMLISKVQHCHRSLGSRKLRNTPSCSQNNVVQIATAAQGDPFASRTGDPMIVKCSPVPSSNAVLI